MRRGTPARAPVGSVSLWTGLAVLLILSACTATPPPPAPKPQEAPVTRSNQLGNYLAGRFAHNRNDWAAAARFYTAAIQSGAAPESPTNSDQTANILPRQAFLLAMSAGAYDKALDLAPQITPADPEHELLVALQVVKAITETDYDTAATVLEAAADSAGLNRYFRPLFLAWARVGQGDYDHALQAFDGLHTAEGGFNTLYRLHKAMVLEQAGRKTEAAPIYQSLATPDAPERIIRKAGTFIERTEGMEAARAFYQTYASQSPYNTVTDDAMERLALHISPPPYNARTGAADALYDVAYALREEGAEELALIYARLALELKPAFPDARFLLADMLIPRGQDGETTALFLQIPPGHPRYVEARLKASELLQRNDQAARALTVLREASTHASGDMALMRKLGDVLRRRDQHTDAIAAYDNVLRSIDRVSMEDWFLFYALGISLERSGDWDRAEDMLQTALKLQPDNPYVLNYLAYGWADRGENLDEALTMLQKAVALRPNDGFIVDSLGWVLYRMGRYDEAVGILEAAVAMEPNDPTLNDHLGDIYWTVGRKREARFQWTRALQYADGNVDPIKIKRKLDAGL